MCEIEYSQIHDFLLRTSKDKYKSIHSLIERNGPLTAPQKAENELFGFLVRTIIGQQLSANAARNIWQRVCALADERNLSIFDLFGVDSLQDIRECGLSANKLKAISELRAAMLSGEISGEEIIQSSYSEIIEKITSVWGLGRWSADMVAIFYCGLPNVFPESDSAVLRGLQLLVGSNDLKVILNEYSPYCSYLCRHIWKGLDDRVIIDS